MKRLLTFLLTVLLFVSVQLSAFALDEEIWFRDYPWGISIKDFERQEHILAYAYSNGIPKGNSVENIITGKEGFLSTEAVKDQDLVKRLILYDYYNVAGYPVNETYLFFTYLPSNGNILNDDENTYLYAAQYSFKTTDRKALYSDLLTKLSSVYGEPNETKTSKDAVKHNHTYAYWYGANDTILVLRDSQNLSNPEYIDIIYASKQGNKVLKELKEILKNTPVTSSPGNVDGL